MKWQKRCCLRIVILPTHRSLLPQTAQQQAALPDIQHPQVALPAAGKKQLPKQSAAAAAAEKEAQDELDRCLPAPPLYPTSLVTLLFAGLRRRCEASRSNAPAIARPSFS